MFLCLYASTRTLNKACIYAAEESLLVHGGIVQAGSLSEGPRHEMMIAVCQVKLMELKLQKSKLEI
jgi:hypothetical protein